MAVDLGNTMLKASVFEGERELETALNRNDSPEAVKRLLSRHPDVEGVIFCSVGAEEYAVAHELASVCGSLPVSWLKPGTLLPIEVAYGSRSTLGADRVAAATGVAADGRSVLLVDAGTAVTLDLVDGMRFWGGNISPGLRLRFASLARYTSRLPLVDIGGEVPDFGHDTVTAIRSGVVEGLVGEIIFALERAKKRFPRAQLVLTGGDADYLAAFLKRAGIPVSTDHSAVARGLVRIYNYNERK